MTNGRPHPLARLPRSVAMLLAVGVLSACAKKYRVGDYVMVSWRESGPYPAYILERKRQRYRVHFDGYPDSCDEDVLIDQIVGLADNPMVPPKPPEGVSCVRPLPNPEDDVLQVYKVGERVKVTWRGSPYPALILEVLARDRFRVRYEGHEEQWDETVSAERIVGRM